MAGFYTNTVGPSGGIAGTYNKNTGTSQMRAYDPTELSQAQLMEAQRAQMPQQMALQQGALDNARQQTANQAARFSSLYSLLSGQLGQNNDRVGGQNTAAPPMTAGPVYNPQQLQQMQNMNASQIQTGAASQNQRTANSMAGRGFGSNSPIAAALQNANDSAARGQIASSNTQLGLNAAQANAQHLLGSQQALSNQWATGNELDIKRRQAANQYSSSLFQALAGLA